MSFGPAFAESLPRDYIQRKIEIVSSWIDEAKEDFQRSKTSFFGIAEFSVTETVQSTGARTHFHAKKPKCTPLEIMKAYLCLE